MSVPAEGLSAALKPVQQQPVSLAAFATEYCKPKQHHSTVIFLAINHNLFLSTLYGYLQRLIQIPYLSL